MKVRHEGRIYDIRSVDEDPDYDNAPEINRMLRETGSIHLPNHKSHRASRIGPFTAARPADQEAEG